MEILPSAKLNEFLPLAVAINLEAHSAPKHPGLNPQERFRSKSRQWRANEECGGAPYGCKGGTGTIKE